MIRWIAVISLLLVMSLSLPAQIGNISFVGEIDPQPNYNPRAPFGIGPLYHAMSPDGRFAFLSSTAFDDTAEQRRLISVRLDPGGAVIADDVNTDPYDGVHVSYSPNSVILAAHLVDPEFGGSDVMRFHYVNTVTGEFTQAGDDVSLDGRGPGGVPTWHPTDLVCYTMLNAEIHVVTVPSFSGVADQVVDTGAFTQGAFAISADGSTLVVLAPNVGGTNDQVVTYDVAQFTGTLTERGRFDPGVDMSFASIRNVIVNSGGTRAAFVDGGAGNSIVTLDITQLGTYTSTVSTIPGAPVNLALSENETVLAANLGTSIDTYNLDADFNLTLRGHFEPEGASSVPFDASNNVLLTPDGSMGIAASAVDALLYTFGTQGPIGVTSAPLDSAATGPLPRTLAASRDFSRVLVTRIESTDPVETAEVYDIGSLRPSLQTQAEFAIAGGTDYGPNSPVAVSALGGAVEVGRSSSTHLFDATLRGLQVTPGANHGPFFVTNMERVDTANQFFLGYQDGVSLIEVGYEFGFLSPLNSRATPVAAGTNFASVEVAASPDGMRLYAPNLGLDRIDVFDTTTDPFTPLTPFQDANLSGPRAATLSPDGSTLAVTYEQDFLSGPGGASVNFFDIDANGELSNRRGVSTSQLAFEGRVRFLSDTRAVVGADFAGAVLLDTEAGAILDQFMPPGCAQITQVATAPGHNRFLGTDPFVGAVAVIAFNPFTDTMSGPASYAGAQISRESRPLVTPDGRFGLIPDATSSVGGVHMIGMDSSGTNLPAVQAVQAGATHRLAMDSAGRRIASVDFEFDRMFVHTLGLLGAPHLASAVLLEHDASRNGIGEQGEVLALGFDRPMTLGDTALLSSIDFHLTNFGATIGGVGVALEMSPISTEAFLTLGAATSGIDTSDPFLAIDINASRPRDTFFSLFEGVPAADLGMQDSNDTGARVSIPFEGRTVPIDAALGGDVTPQPNPAARFPLHRLEIPPNSLGANANFTITPVAASVAAQGFPNAVTFSTDATPVGDLFAIPATLTLQYDALAENSELGRLRGSVDLVQLHTTLGVVTATPITTTLTIDAQRHTVCIPIRNLNPLNLSLDEGSLQGAGGGTVGTFATLPVNPVEERTINIAPETGGAAGGPSSPATLSSGGAGLYTGHQIEFPGYVETSAGDPNRTVVTMRSSTLFDRVSLGGGQSFPVQSGAIFTVNTRNAGGNPVAFADPVNVTVEFMSRAEPTETDIVQFDGTTGSASQMRAVQDTDPALDVNFALVGGMQSGNSVVLNGLTPLTSATGVITFGAVVDPNVVGGVTKESIVGHILGESLLVGQDLMDADQAEPFGVVDAADLVTFINP